MPAIKRQRVSATTAKNASSLGSKQPGINAFTRVSKASTTAKCIIDKNNYVDSIAVTQLENDSVAARKRKQVTDDESQTETAEDASSLLSLAHNISRDIKPLPQRRQITSQRLSRSPQNQLLSQVSTPADTSTKGAKGRLDHIFSSAKNSTPILPASNKSISSAETTISHDSPLSSKLPAELLDLINLHASFLTALSLHYAHNGTNSPADLRMLCPDVSRAWGKRSVTLDDIRRTLGVMNKNYPVGVKGQGSPLSTFSLSDYGHGKICIEIEMEQERTGSLPRPLNENLLNEIYVGALRTLWQDRVEPEMPLKYFIEHLPIEPITLCSSVVKMSPLLAKGQRRLEDLKAGINIRKDATKAAVSTVQTPNGTKPTLLERLRAKQLQQSTLPPPPSKADLGRKAALQRVEEVVAVLTVLSTSSSIGQQRVSFTMPTVLGKLRDSFKTPMSKEEGETVVRLLASDIAPEWLKIVKMGKIDALVVNRDERPNGMDIKLRIKRAG